MRLTKCGWVDCPNCKGGFVPFADEDESVLTKHDEELIINPSPAPQEGGVVTGQQAFSKVMVMRTGKTQACAAGCTRQSERIRKRINAALSQSTPAQTQSFPQLPDDGVKPPKEIERGKAAYAQRAREKVKKQIEASLAPLAGNIRVLLQKKL